MTRRNASGSQVLTRSYVYFTTQELCKTIEAEAGTTVYSYDPAGNLRWSAGGLDYPEPTRCESTTPYSSGRRIDRTYDARNRLQTLRFPDGLGDQDWTYTKDGLPDTITTYNGANQTLPAINAYHNKRRLLNGQGESIEQSGWYTWGLGYGYDGNGNLSTHAYPNNVTVTYAPNALGQPTQVRDAAGQAFATGVTYFPNGAIKQFSYGNGIVHTLTQNARQLPDRSRDVYGSAIIHDDGYDYDPNGNVAAISDAVAGNRGNRTMTYDGLDRLLTTVSPMYGSTGTTYSYDVLDNLTRVIAPGRNHFYCYDANWRLTNVKTGSCSGTSVIGLGYDVQGNLDNKNGADYVFDFGNRLRQVTGVESYRYDGHGRRVSAWRPVEGNVLSLYGNDGVLRYQHDNRQGKYLTYFSLGGSLVAIRETPLGTTNHTYKYQHTDALGSPVAVTNASRVVIERSEYEPYGQLLTRPLSAGPGYTGHVMDVATGMAYMQQRYYDPAIGRFLSVDPVTADGDTGGNFNRYKYAANNPYRFTDPDGRRDWDSLNAHSSNMSGIGAITNARSIGPIDCKSCGLTKGQGDASGGSKNSKSGTAPTIKYNAPPPRTVPVSGDNLNALECTATCLKADELLVTGGAETSGHSSNSLHYDNQAVDIPGVPFNNLSHRDVLMCGQSCGYTHGWWEEKGSIYKSHWHLQSGPGSKVPALPLRGDFSNDQQYEQALDAQRSR